MKNYPLFITCLFLIGLVGLFTSCEYNVSEPQWDKKQPEYSTPIITSINPAQALPGVNTITIYGENFIGSANDTTGVLFGVYFDKIPADIILNSETSITVRRPNLVADSATIKVAPSQTLVVAKYSPYRIDPVVQTYGAFLDNNTLEAVAVDENENVYVVENISQHTIVKITPDGQKETIGICSYSPNRAIIGPDSMLYFTRSNKRDVFVFDLNSDTETSRWIHLPSGTTVSYGIFDAERYFYTGGQKSDLVIVAPNPSETNPTVTKAGYYDNDNILEMTIYQNYIYLIVLKAEPDEQHPELAVWRHSLNGSGTVGNMELVLDLSSNEITASKTITTFKFDVNGNLFIGIDSDDPLLIKPADSNNIDYFYKGILPSNCKQFCWGAGSYIYMIVGDNDLNIDWELYRIDMGAAEGI